MNAVPAMAGTPTKAMQSLIDIRFGNQITNIKETASSSMEPEAVSFISNRLDLFLEDLFDRTD
jgi:hypothetical protein